MKEIILNRLKNIQGNVGFYYKNLVTNEVIEYNSEEPMLAASIIKLTVMVEAFNQIKQGMIDKNYIFTTIEEDKVPSCGALNYMEEGLQVTLKDLYTLMIILSDNYATNILIDKLGITNINNRIKSLELKNTVLRRKMFDSKGAKEGLENYISARDMGTLLEKMYKGKVIDKESSREMIEIMKNQRLNSKIPFLFNGKEEKVQIAHKTGEDGKITHDVGIVYSKEPFIICFTGNNVDVPVYERLMQDLTYDLYLENNIYRYIR